MNNCDFTEIKRAYKTQEEIGITLNQFVLRARVVNLESKMTTPSINSFEVTFELDSIGFHDLIDYSTWILLSTRTGAVGEVLWKCYEPQVGKYYYTVIGTEEREVTPNTCPRCGQYKPEDKLTCFDCWSPLSPDVW